MKGKVITMLTKKDIAKEIAAENNLSVAQSERIVNKVFNRIKETVAAGDSAFIYEFGTFSAADKKAYTATNPQTKEKVDVPAKVVPKFKAGSAFKNEVQSSAYARARVKSSKKGK